MNKPELLYTHRGGGTIHSYELTGGKTVYDRFLACFQGSCNFYDNMDDAKRSINTYIP